MPFQFDMIVPEWRMVAFAGDGPAVHQQLGGNTKPIDNEAVLRRNQQVPNGLVFGDRAFAEADGRNVFRAGMAGNINTAVANPLHRLQDFPAVTDYDNLLARNNGFDFDITPGGADAAARRITNTTDHYSPHMLIQRHLNANPRPTGVNFCPAQGYVPVLRSYRHPYGQQRNHVGQKNVDRRSIDLCWFDRVYFG